MSADPYRDVKAVVPKRAIPPWVWLIVAAYVARQSKELTADDVLSLRDAWSAKLAPMKRRKYPAHGPQQFARAIGMVA